MINLNYTFERKENEKIAKYFNLGGGGETSGNEGNYSMINDNNVTLHSNQKPKYQSNNKK